MTWRSADSFLADLDERQVDVETRRIQQRLERVRKRTEVEMTLRAERTAEAELRAVSLRHELEMDVYLSRGAYRFRPYCACGWQARRGFITRSAAERSYEIHLNPGR